jgi:hypothetical protein
MENYSNHEDAKLVFLLRQLINPRLLLVHRRIERLRTRLEKGELDETDTLRYIAAVKEYSTGFGKFMDSIPDYGIFLDTWWYTQEAVNNVYRRFLEWSQAAKEDAHITFDHRRTREQLEDPTVREWHEIYGILKLYIDTGAFTDNGEKERLLSDQMPEALKGLHQKLLDHRGIFGLNVSQIANLDLKTAIELRILKEAFIKRCMDWYTTLSVCL